MNSFENKTQKLICVFSQIMLYSFVVLCCQSPDSGSGSGPFWWTKLIGSQWCSSPPQFNPRWTLYGPRSWVTGYDKHLDSNICDVVEICVPTSTHLVYKSFQKSLKQLVTVFIRKKARSIFSSGLIHIYCCRLDQVKIMCSVCVFVVMLERHRWCDALLAAWAHPLQQACRVLADVREAGDNVVQVKVAEGGVVLTLPPHLEESGGIWEMFSGSWIKNGLK